MHGRDHAIDGMDPIPNSSTLPSVIATYATESYTSGTGFDQTVRLTPNSITTNDDTCYDRDGFDGIQILKSGEFLVQQSIEIRENNGSDEIPPHLCLFLEVYSPDTGPSGTIGNSTLARTYMLMPNPAVVTWVTPGNKGIVMKNVATRTLVTTPTSSSFCSFFTALIAEGATQNWQAAAASITIKRLGETAGNHSITL